MALASRFGRYGYRRITALLRQEGWSVKHKRVERLWRKEGLRVPRKQPKRGRLWLAEGAIVRRRAERPNDVCSYDFVFERTADGRALKLLVVVDEYTRECLAIVVARRLPPTSALTTAPSSPPRRCLTGSSAWACRRSSSSLAAPGRMAPSSRLTAKLGDECLNRERFDTLLEAQILSEQWRFAYNHLRPHSSLGYRPPAPSAPGCPPSRRRRPTAANSASAAVLRVGSARWSEHHR